MEQAEAAQLPALPRHGHIVFSQAGFPIGSILEDRSYWAIKLNDGKWLCEMDGTLTNRGPLDWTLDVVSTGDWAKIVELWLFCPPSPTSPFGNTARLPILPAGTAFQLKIGTVDSNIGTSLQRQCAHIIGRVTDMETGECECYVFDYSLWGMVLQQAVNPETGEEQLVPWKSNIFAMGTWRPSIPGQPQLAPIGRLNHAVLGIHLPDYRTSDCGCGE